MAKQLNVTMKFTADTTQAKQQLQELQTNLKNITSGNFHASKNWTLTKDIKDATSQATELRVALESAMDVDTGNLDLQKFNKALNSGKIDLATYGKSLQSLGPEGQRAFQLLSKSIIQAEIPLKRANGILAEFKTTLMNTARWQLSSSILHGFMGAMQSAYGYAKDLNESLNNIRIVTGYSVDEMSRFAIEANKAAKALSATTTDYTNASLIYYQQGLNTQEVKERTDITIKMANVARQSAEVVSDQMTAVWNNFDNGSKSLEYYADVMTALGAATASSTDEIAAGLEKFAAISDTVGLSYEYATSALATVTATTRQSAEVVGTAFKTLFARMEGLKLGETLEDGTTLNQYSEAMNAVGVNIKNANGELKDMDTILKELAGVWETLDKDEQVALAQKVAGVRQYTQLIALMDHWDFMEENFKTAENATGALQDQADIYAESWEAAEKRVKASMEDVFDSVLEDKFFIKLTDTLADFIDVIGAAVDGLGGMKGVALLIGQILLKSFGPELSKSLNSFVNKINFTTKKLNELKQTRINELKNSIQNQTTPTGVALKTSLDSQADLSNELIAKQTELERIGKSLTEEEKKHAQILLDQNHALGDQVLKYAQLQEEAEELIKKEQKIIALKMRGSTNSEQSVDKIKKAEAQTVIDQTNSVLKENISKRLASLQGSGNKENTVQTLTSISNALAETKSRFQDYFNLLKDQKGNIVGAAQEFEKIKIAIDSYMNGINSMITDNAEDEIEQLKEKIEALLNLLDTTQADINVEDLFDLQGQEEFQGITNELEAAGAAALDLGTNAAKGAMGVKDLEEQSKQAKKRFSEMGNQALSVSDGMVQMGQAFMSSMQVFNSLQSIVDTFKEIQNGTVSTKDAVISLTSSFSMLATSGVQTFNSLQTAAKSFDMKAGKLFLIMAAIEAAVAALAWGYSQLQKMRNADKIAAEAANESLKELSKAAQDAKSQLDTLVSDVDKYNGLIEQLDKCTKNTEEWSQKLQEVNNQTKDLLSQYPELLKYENLFNDDGTLNLEILKEFQELQKQNSLILQMAELKVQAAAGKAAFESRKTDFARGETNWQGVSQKAGQAYQNAYSPTSPTTGTQAGGVEIPDWLEKLGKIFGPMGVYQSTGGGTANVSTEMTESIAAFGEGVAETKAIEEKKEHDIDTVISNYQLYGEKALSESELRRVLGIDAAEELDSSMQMYLNSLRFLARENNKYAEMEKNAYKASVLKWAETERGQKLAGEDGFSETEAAILASKLKESEAAEKEELEGLDNNALFEMWNQTQGTDYRLASDGVKTGEDGRTTFSYIDNNGEIKAIDLDVLKSVIATKNALNTFELQVSETTQFLSNLENKYQNETEMGEGLKDFIATGNFNGMSEDSFNKFFEGLVQRSDTGDPIGIDKEATKTMLPGMLGLNTFDEAVKLFGLENADDLFNKISAGYFNAMEQVEDIEKDLEVSNSALKSYKGITGNNKADYDINEKQIISDLVEKAFLGNGSEGLKSVETIFDNLGAEGDEFAAALKDVNWNTADIISFKKKLTEAGVSINNLSDEDIQNLIDAMQEASSASENVEVVKQKFTTLKAILNEIENSGDTISPESYAQIDSDIGEKYFTKMLDGTYMLTGSAEEFKKATADIKFDELESSVASLKEELITIKEIKEEANKKDFQSKATTKDQALLQLDYLEKYGNMSALELQEYREEINTDFEAFLENHGNKIASAIKELGNKESEILSGYEGTEAELKGLVESYALEYFLDQLPDDLDAEESAAAVEKFGQYMALMNEDMDYTNIEMEDLKEGIDTFAETMVQATNGVKHATNLLSELRAGNINSENIESNEDYKELEKQFDALKNLYPEIISDVEILENKWLAGTTAYIDALDRVQNKLYEMQITGLSDSVEENISSMEEKFGEDLENLDFKVGADVEPFEEAMNKILEAEYEINVRVHAEAEQEFDSIIEGAKHMEEYASKIGEDYVVAAEDIRELNQAFPGILQNMKLLEDGSVQLNKVVVQNAMKAAETEIKTDAQSTINRLQNQANVLRAKQTSYQNIANAARTLAELEKSNDKDSVDSQKKAADAKKIISDSLTEIENSNSKLAADAEILNNAEVATSSNENANQTAENWANAWGSAATNSYEFAAAAIHNMKAVESGGGMIYDPMISANYIGGNGTVTEATLGETTKKAVEDLDTTSDEWTRIADAYQDLADSTAVSINDIEGMIGEIGAVSYDIDTTLGSVSKGEGPKKDEDKKEKEKYDPKFKSLEEEIERYHEINEELEDLDRNLNRIQKSKDRAFGKQKVAWFKEEIKAINKNIEAEEDKLAEAKRNALYDQSRLNAFGATYDYQTGRVTNYDEMMAREVALYNAAEATGNEALIESAKLRFDDFKQVMSNYEDSLDTIAETEDKLQDYVYEVADLKLAQIEYEVEIRLNINEDDLEYIDYQLSKLENKSFNQAETMGLLVQQADALVEKSNIINNGINQLLNEKGVSSADMEAIKSGTISNEKLASYGFTEDEIEYIRSQSKELLDINKNLIETNEKIWDTLLDYWEETSEKMDNLLARYEYYDSIVEGFINWVDIVGTKALGLSKDLAAGMKLVQVDVGKSSIKSYKTALETEKENEKSYREAMGKAKAEDEIKEWQDLIDKSEKRQAELQQQIIQTTAENLTLVMEAYQEKMEAIFDELEKKMSGVYENFEQMAEVFDRKSILRDQYIPEYKQLYELTKLNRQLEKELNNTSNLKAQQKIKDLQKEINSYMASGKKMSEYDLEYLQKKYDMKLAEIALEESQNAKTTVRLRRDNEGAWGYVYTADETKTNEMVQKYEDSLYEIQELNETYINEISSAYIKTQQEMMEALASIQLSDYSSFADYKKAIDETAAFYQERLNYYSSEMGKVIDNNLTLYNIDVSGYTSSYTSKIQAGESFTTHFRETILGDMLGNYNTLQGYTETFRDFIGTWDDENSILGQLSKNWKDWQIDLDGVFTEVGISLNGPDGLVQSFIAAVGGDDPKNYQTVLGRLGLLDSDGNVSLDNVQKGLGLTQDEALQLQNDFQTAMNSQTGAQTYVKEFGDETLDTVYGKDRKSGVYGGLKDTDSEVNKLSQTVKREMPQMTRAISAWAAQWAKDYEKVINANEEAYRTYKQLYDQLASSYVDPKNTTTNTIITEYVTKGDYSVSGSSSTTTSPVTTSTPSSSGGQQEADNLLQRWIDGIFSAYVGIEIARMAKASKNGRPEKYDAVQYASQMGKKTSGGVTITAGNPGIIVDPNGDLLHPNQVQVRFDKDRKHPVWVSWSSLRELEGYDTGGYTGDWGANGRLALLHEKELVLNKQDTSNMLNAIDVVRGLVNNLEFKAAQQMFGGNTITPKTVNQTIDRKLQQQVSISAEFPGVQDHNEIETALNNLLTQSSQYIGRY